MSIKIKINNVNYEIDEGYTITENYNETLDSANIRISQLTSRIENLEPLDRADFYDDNTLVRTFCIDTWTETQTSINPAIYDYEISLVSETKLLEGVVLPNRAITIPRGQSAKKIWYYLDQYLTMYGEKSNNISVWSFATRVQTKFNSIDCPEFQWNGPTLREVLTDLMMVADCIPVMRNNVIDYIDIGTTTGTMPTAGVNYIQRSMSLENYVSELRMDMQNVMQTSVSNVDNTVKTVEYISFSPEENLLTTNTLQIKTQFPILKINKIYLFFYAHKHDTRETKFYTYKVDVTDFVKEYKEYQLLKVAYRRTDISSGHEDEYQNYCFYYERNNNIITGFEKTTLDEYGGSVVGTEIELLKYLKTTEFYTSTESEGYVDINIVYSNFFQIEYETLSDSVFSASKTNKLKHNRVTVDNQTNSWVDAWNQGFMEYQKANRLSNENLMINQRCITETPIEIGQVYDSNNIVYQTTKQYYTNHTEVNAYATKNYVLRNYFTGVKSKIRTWVNAQDEALIRHELYKTYCEFSFSNFTTYTLAFNDYLASSLIGYSSSEPIEYIEISNSYLTSSINNCITRAMGNSIVLTGGFNDNYIAKKKIDTSKVNFLAIASRDEVEPSTEYGKDFLLPQIQAKNNYGGIPFINDKYTDDLGNFETINFRFGTGIEYPDNINIDYGNQTSSQAQKSIETIFKNGENITLTGVKISDTNRYVYKDNREIYKASYQYEYGSDTDDIYITKELIKRNRMISLQSNIQVSIFIGDNYIKGKEDVTGLTVDNNCHVSSNVDNLKELIISNSTQYAGKALYIAAGTYNTETSSWDFTIMLGMKLPTNFNGKFYLNLKRNRLD